MQHSNVSRLMDAIKQGIPQGSAPSASTVLQDVEAVMMYLSSSDAYDRDSYHIRTRTRPHIHTHIHPHTHPICLAPARPSARTTS